MNCQNCGKSILDTAKVCGYCGRKVELAPVSCPECGKEAREGAKVCGYCGYRFEAPAIQAGTEIALAEEDALETPVSAESSETQAEAEMNREEIKPEKLASEAQLEAGPAVETVQAAPPETVEAEAEAGPEVKPAQVVQPEIVEDKPEKPRKKTEKPVKITNSAVKKKYEQTKKRISGWVWGVIGLLLVGIAAAVVFFFTNRLPSQVTENLSSVKIVRTENFTGSSVAGGETKNVNIVNGAAQINGTGNFMEAYVTFKYQPLVVGDGLLALFMIEPRGSDQWWLIDLYTKSGNAYYGSVGFSEWYHPFTEIELEGSDAPFSGWRIGPKPDVWYYVLFAVLDKNEIMVRVWEKDNPERVSVYTWHLDPKLRNRNWFAAFYAHTGKMYLESVQFISFTEN